MRKVKKMKKIIALLLCVLCLMTLFACKGAEKNEEIKERLDEKVAAAYVGDSKIEDKITLGSLNIVIKEKTFYVNDNIFYFKDFEKAEKMSMNFEGGMLDVYVKDGVLEKCETENADLTKRTVYDIKGKGVSATEYVYDEYGNAVLVSSYDGEGNLTGFYEASYKDFKISDKRVYNASLDLTKIIKYYYSEKGELEKEAVYSPDLKLQKVIEH